MTSSVDQKVRIYTYEIEGEIVEISDALTALDYQDALHKAKFAKLTGAGSYVELRTAARQYIAAMERYCEAKGMKAPKLKSRQLTR